MKTYTNEMTGIEWVEIEVAEGQFTAMTKETYEAQQAEQSTPIVIDEASTI
jgi:hypothetical protein